MLTRTIEVVQLVTVTVDEGKFTPEFMAEFRKSFYDLDTVEEHMQHLAQMYARGVCDDGHTFIEGYGIAREFGITLDADTESVELVAEAPPQT